MSEQDFGAECAAMEEGWLLEKGLTYAPDYLTIHERKWHWTKDHNKAIRLSRRQDAVKINEHFLLSEVQHRITCHSWEAARRQPAPEPRQVRNPQLFYCDLCGKAATSIEENTSICQTGRCLLCVSPEPAQPAPEPVAGEWRAQQGISGFALYNGNRLVTSGLSKSQSEILITELESSQAQVKRIAEFAALVAYKGKELNAELSRCRDALQSLYDHQNGCPLPKYEAGWNKAMAMAQAVLTPAKQ